MAVAIRVAPFKRLTAWLDLAQVGGRPGARRGAAQDAIAIGWAVRAVAVRTPWTSTCLAQALAGVQMLRRRGITSTLTLGVALAPDKTERMEAHAWLQHGGVDGVKQATSGLPRFRRLWANSRQSSFLLAGSGDYAPPGVSCQPPKRNGAETQRCKNHSLPLRLRFYDQGTT